MVDTRSTKPSSNSSVKSSSTSKPLDTCPRCTSEVSSDDPAVQCENCSKWYHCDCIGIAHDLYEAMIKFPSDAILCICSECRASSHPHQSYASVASQQRQLQPVKAPRTSTKTSPITISTPDPTVTKITTATLPGKPSQPSSRIAKATNTTNTPKTKYQARKDSVVVIDMPELAQGPLHLRDAHDRSQWAGLCDKMSIVPITPISITRLARKPDSAYAGHARMARVLFQHDVDLEEVLLSAHKLQGDGQPRIFPDIPWAERQRRKQAKLSATPDRSRNVIIRGVPQNTPSDPDEDVQQWRFLAKSLNLDHVVAQRLHRLQSNEQNDTPGLLKITFSSCVDASQVLEAARYRRSFLPPAIRFHPDRSKEDRDQRRKEYNERSGKFVVQLEPPKNDLQPASPPAPLV